MQARRFLLFHHQKYFYNVVKNQSRCSSNWSVGNNVENKQVSDSNYLGRSQNNYMEKLKKEKERLGKRGGLYKNKYISFLINHPKFLLVKDGFKSMLSDVPKFIVAQKKILESDKGFYALNLEELVMYFETMANMKKLLPLFIIACIPFATILIVPLALYFPRQLLTSHFWTESQKVQFTYENYRNRYNEFRTVLKYLENNSKHLKTHDLYTEWSVVMEYIKDEKIPEITHISKCAPLFDTGGPFELKKLPIALHGILLKMHGLRALMKYSALRDRVQYIKLTDTALIEDDGPENMSNNLLQKYCLERGIYPYEMRKEELVVWANQWLELCQRLDDYDDALILIAPALLGINHPSNLLFRKSQQTD